MSKIGVIMSTYNGKERIDNSIKSILEQSYTDFKLIICDDGSTDGTYEYLKNKYNKNEKIYIFQNNNKNGLAYALNLCLNYCKDCEYIARMDDDDFSYPNRFKEQIEFLENNPNISFVGSNVDIYDGEKIIEERKLIAYPQKKDFIWNSPFVHPAIMFRYTPLKESDFYRVSKETLRGQDYDLFMRMYSRGFKGANIQKNLLRYTENNKTKKKRTFKVRLGECKVRRIGFKKMGIIWYAFPFILKPLVAYVKDHI